MPTNAGKDVAMAKLLNRFYIPIDIEVKQKGDRFELDMEVDWGVYDKIYEYVHNLSLGLEFQNWNAEA